MSGAETPGAELASGQDGSTFTFEGKVYHLEPKALSSKVVRQLVRLYDQQMRPLLPEMIAALNRCSTDDEREIVKEAYGYFSQRMEKVSYMYTTEDGVAVAIHMCCPDVGTIEEATRIVDEHPNFIDLVTAVVGATTLAAVGN